MKLVDYSTFIPSGKSLVVPILLLTLFPLVYLVFMFCVYSIDTPYMDQWEFVLTLQKYYSGHLSWHDLWAQHNEHRPFVGRLLLLAIALPSHWNIRWELVGNIVCGILLFALVAWQGFRFHKEFGPCPYLPVLPFLSVLAFSLSQWQNWFLGWQLTVFMSVVGSVAGFAVLAAPGGNVLVAICLGLMGTLSFSAGLAFWPLGALCLELSPVSSLRKQWQRRIVWYSVSLILFVGYFRHYVSPAEHPSTQMGFHHPLLFVTYAFAYLGAPVAAFNPYCAVVAGVIGFFVFVVYFLGFVREGTAVSTLAFLVCLAVYSLVGAVMTAVGRVGFGLEQSLSSRYITIATCIWYVNVLFVYTRIVRRMQAQRWKMRYVVPVMLMIGCFGVSLAYNAKFGTERWLERRDFRVPARDALLAGENMDLLQRLHPDPELVLVRRQILMQYHLSIFYIPSRTP